jgi:1,2-diacylglycerol 3-beta-galactosyltransferase
MSQPERDRVPLLFLVSDTGGGHRRAAVAVAEALEEAWPGRFAPVLHDPLMGPGAPWLVRRAVGLYGPLTRLVPWAWGALYRSSDSPRRVRLLWKSLLASVRRDIAGAMARSRAELVVSFHPLTTGPAVLAAGDVPTATVVTDLVSVHNAWAGGAPDLVTAPSAAVAAHFEGGRRCVVTGLPVPAKLRGGPFSVPERAQLRRALGLPAGGFVVVVAGGGEGCGHVGRHVRALATAGWDDLFVVAICGRNRRLQHDLEGAGLPGVTVKGWVADMADWLRAADLLVTKAGPGTLAEAACAGTPIVVTSQLPGQERGNAEMFVRAGAAIWARRPEGLVREVGRFWRDPSALRLMRAASARLGRPGAAREVAGLLAELAAPAVTQ